MESIIMQPDLLNGLSLAYIGDAIYELMIREYIISSGVSKVNNLHKKVIKFTSGTAQAQIIHYFLANNILNENELSIFKRGRNSHIKSSRKNINIADYLDATGFEALIGYLYLTKSNDRLNELINLSIDIMKGESL